jgi:antitoxin component YwqK of YwqJK toxin-antitoxin module
MVFSILASNIMKLNCSVCYILFLVAMPVFLFSQKKTKAPAPKTIHLLSYEVLDDGDTINKLDNQNRKHGKWLIVVAEQRGEDGYVDFGSYRDDKKINLWRRFTSSGQLISVENYKKGKLDGEVKYYEDGRLFCIGNYYALKDGATFDTIMVEDPITNIETPVVVRCEVGSVRHGLWTYYESETGKINKIVEYHADKIIYEKTYLTQKDSVDVKRQWKTIPKAKPFDSEMVWYTDKNKKQVSYIDMPKKVVYRKM